MPRLCQPRCGAPVCHGCVSRAVVLAREPGTTRGPRFVTIAAWIGTYSSEVGRYGDAASVCGSASVPGTGGNSPCARRKSQIAGHCVR